MGIKAKLANLDAIGDQTVSLKTLYTEKDGAFFLDVEKVDGYGLDNQAAMRTTMEDAKAQKKDALEKVRTLESERDTLRLTNSELEASVDSKSKEKFDAAKAEITKQYDGKIAEGAERYTGLHGKYVAATLGSQLTIALAKHGANELGLEALPKMLEGAYGFDENDNPIVLREDGKNPRMGDDFKNLSIDSHVGVDIKTKYPGFFNGSGASGSGSKGGSGGAGGGAGSGNSITRKEYEAMTPAASMKHCTDGGIVTDS